MAIHSISDIKVMRMKQNLLLRKLAYQLCVDVSIMSKVERGDRQLKEEHIPLLARILEADVEELQTLWLFDPIIALENYENRLMMRFK